MYIYKLAIIYNWHHMDTCFVIQPFDKGNFDDRYNDTFQPAIQNAGLEPYRVDKDFSVRVPIDTIEENIRLSKICFAEITTDNPNVWYELGYAFASSKDVVMVCSDERQSKFPFDIQHKHIITYKTGSSSHFETLKNNITEKLKAFLHKGKQVQNLIDNPVKESEGLKQHEISMMILLLENQLAEDQTVSAMRLQRDMEAIGFTRAASNMAFRELKGKLLIEQDIAYSEQGDKYYVFKLTIKGENWLLNNQDKIQFRKPQANNTIDDLPF